MKWKQVEGDQMKYRSGVKDRLSYDIQKHIYAQQFQINNNKHVGKCDSVKLEKQNKP